MAIIEPSAQFTPREHQQMEYEKEMFAKQADFNIEVKRLELEATKLEAKWSSWLKLPITIIKLPVFCLLAIGYIIGVATKHEPSDNFWKFMQ